jgi:hypothetical protein
MMAQSKNKPQVPGVPKQPVPRKYRLYWDDPLMAGNAVSSVVIRQIGRVSPDGAP